MEQSENFSLSEQIQLIFQVIVLSDMHDYWQSFWVVDVTHSRIIKIFHMRVNGPKEEWMQGLMRSWLV